MTMDTPTSYTAEREERHDEAMIKLLHLALRNIAKKWIIPINDWKAAMNRFTILLKTRCRPFNIR
jgi:transposase-like protein